MAISRGRRKRSTFKRKQSLLPQAKINRMAYNNRLSGKVAQ